MRRRLPINWKKPPPGPGSLWPPRKNRRRSQKLKVWVFLMRNALCSPSGERCQADLRELCRIFGGLGSPLQFPDLHSFTMFESHQMRGEGGGGGGGGWRGASRFHSAEQASNLCWDGPQRARKASVHIKRGPSSDNR